MSRNYHNYSDDDDGAEDFVPLDSLQSAKNLKEIEEIDSALIDLCESIQKYLDDAKNMWDTVFAPFINTCDCATLQKVSDRDFHVFVDFMTTQRVYKLMITSKVRLEKRKRFLLAQSR
ncbi:hypothetical protein YASMINEVIRUS_799 [Yasminevirus sp. GU-2018]|uniref:Uncharacterized protein n=1 Tax=Yasminevirus sp. GU-2018 TaxID=2420051 RepID=A0A5K0UB84_9VIRU|nr:hypothetical protein YASMINEVIRUS_799 [Yasminevirus sp. GU-2018]